MNFEDYEQLEGPSVVTSMTAGAIAGVLEHCVMYPLDSVKTRMQSLSPRSAGQTIVSTMANMIKSEGLTRPLRGMAAVVAGAGPAHAFYFATYEYTKDMFSKMSPHHNQINYIVSAVSATLIHDAISNPTEVIKQRLQMYGSPYKSVFQCASGVYRAEGLKAFYRSYMTQLVMNLPYQAIHFTTYEFFQTMLNKDHKYNPPVHVIAGGAAGAAASAFTTPLDVVKTLLNTQETGIGLTKGMQGAIRQIYTMAGPLGFFKGLAPRVLYAMPATAICWSSYEFFKYILSNKSRDEYQTSSGGTHISTAQHQLQLQHQQQQQQQKQQQHQQQQLQQQQSSAKDVKAEKTRIDDAKLGLRYVLPTSVSAHDSSTDIPSTIRDTTIKPRELPSMSGAGVYTALSLNTRHTETTTRTYDRGCST